MVPLMRTDICVPCQAPSPLTLVRSHVVQSGGGISRRRVSLGRGITRCFLHRTRAQERQSPPAVSGNSPPHSSHLNGTTLRPAIPSFTYSSLTPRPTVIVVERNEFRLSSGLRIFPDRGKLLSQLLHPDRPFPTLRNQGNCLWSPHLIPARNKVCRHL